MLRLTKDFQLNKDEWNAAGVTLPRFDVEKMQNKTKEQPVWLHFGAGNIFRGFIARLQQRLLNEGLSECGIIAADTFDSEIIERIFCPYDNLAITVDLSEDGTKKSELIASVSEALFADLLQTAEKERLSQIFKASSLQIVSFTITEKGYALRGMSGEYLPVVATDISEGPKKARHAMSVVCALVYERFKSGAMPLALVSMDNCSHNGEKLKFALLEIAKEWEKKRYVERAFVQYLLDERKISFPWSMIDKITPRPASSVKDYLTAAGIADMSPITTTRGSYIAPFVNAEIPQYLVIEDSFPNGRPALEKAGVYMTDRETVNKAERMKVTTCLNPLHTALAIFGCIFGYSSIALEMRDEDLRALVMRIGYDEGLPVAVDPGIINPRAFLDEVIDKRLPNPFIPDMPQRIATDTSQKIPIRFGETIKSYISRDDLDVTTLKYIPLVIAAWLRYLIGVDDSGNGLVISSDPLLEMLQRELSGVEYGKPESCEGKLGAILSNKTLFAADLCECGLSYKIETMLSSMLEGKGAVRRTLKKYLS